MNVKINILLRTNITSPVAHCAPGQLGDGRPGTQETGGHRGRSLRQGERGTAICSAAVANVNEKWYYTIDINQYSVLCSDVSAVRVQPGPVPRGVRAHRVRDLRGRHRARQPGGQEEIDTCRNIQAIMSAAHQ